MAAFSLLVVTKYANDFLFIFAYRGPFVSALGKSWCPDHFVCANPQCGVKLLDIGFVEEGGLLYCERDYAAYFAPYCDRCGQVIVGVRFYVFSAFVSKLW